MTDDIEHRTLVELAALFGAGALDDAERRAFEAHVRTCRDCARELQSYAPVYLGMSLAVPQIAPPPSLRARVVGDSRSPSLEAVVPPPPAVRPWWNAGWLSAAAMVVIAIAALGLLRNTVTLRQQIGFLQQQLRETIVRLERSERQLDAATRAVNGAELRMAVLMAPDLARVELSGQPPAPRATGRAFWSRTRGLVFAATALPPLSPGRTYQLWIVTARDAVSAGLVRPDDSGAVTAFFRTPADISPPVAMAVTIEPDGGVPAPTGDKYLIGPAH